MPSGLRPGDGNLKDPAPPADPLSMEPDAGGRARRPGFVGVPCQVCGVLGGEVVYERACETVALGRVRVRLVLCPRCGFLYASPRPTRARLAEHYRVSDFASGAVWRERGAGSRHERFLARRAAFVRDVLGERARAPGRALDVGASQGDQLAALGLAGWELVGLEPSRPAAARARERGVEVVEGTLEESPLRAGSFDLVTGFSVLEHVWNVRVAMARIERLLAPGGVLVLEVPDSMRPVAQVAEFFSFEHLSHFTRGTLSRLARDFGFRPLAVEPAAGYGMLLGARKEGRAAVRHLALADERDELRGVLDRYRRERASFETGILRRFEELFARLDPAGGKVAIHGAGEHTLFLLDLVDFDGRIAAILDSDPVKQGRPFLRWPVRAPEELPGLGVSAVVLSSEPFQEEMAASLEPITAPWGIELVRCYARAGEA